ncbi:MAG: HAD-IB family phosphatase [Actinomycetota bacterium]|nr:HAD-IB family phosphatase [Actinomycetota bacterium]
MLPVRAVLLDFDGTACPTDVSEALLVEFGEPGWQALDEAVERGEIGLRECVDRQAAMLRASRDEMVSFALERHSVDPTLPPFVDWARGAGLAVEVVSDGFGFHIRPMLEAAGLGSLPVLTNEFDGGRLAHLGGHPVCVGCGTCKMLAAVRLRERHGPVAFVGDGTSDRYGALYSDLVFAKPRLGGASADARLRTRPGVSAQWRVQSTTPQNGTTFGSQLEQ